MKPIRAEIGWHLRAVTVGAFTIIVAVAVVLSLRGDDRLEPVWAAGAAVSVGATVEESQPVLVMTSPEARPETALEDLTDVRETRFIAPIEKGTILSEAHLEGSPLSRKLPANQVIVDLTSPVFMVQHPQRGDSIDIWGDPGDCLEYLCTPTLLAAQVDVLDAYTQPAEEWGGTEQTGLTVALDKNQVGPVLAAEPGGTLRFVINAPSTHTATSE